MVVKYNSSQLVNSVALVKGHSSILQATLGISMQSSLTEITPCYM